ncbi:MAG: phosphoglycerate dehydrogenase-like enzyme [Lysobacterales bacterium]|jgi:phosphoglycerate dehydrogenase-like enzyme
MPDFLIVSSDAEELANEINLLAETPLEIASCTSAKQALAEYTAETVLFGRPDMIAEILPSLPAVNWVQSSWAGVDPLLALDRRDYDLTGIKDVFGAQMSEYVFAHLLAHELKLLKRNSEQLEHNWYQVQSGSLQGKRLGIMGTGSIGRHIANTAKSFGLSVTGLSRSGCSAPGFDEVVQTGLLHDWLGKLDYLVSALPNTSGTDKLLDAASLAELPAHCYLINVGRSNVLDEAALMNALSTQRLAGAALDVFDAEPLPQDSPLWNTPNLSITAHIAAASHSSLIVPIFLENYRRYRAGMDLKFKIDFEAGY